MSKTLKRTSALNPGMDRRSFVKAASMAGAAAAIGLRPLLSHATEKAVYGNPDVVDTDPRASFVRSVCLMCHSGCGIQAKIVDGRVVKVDGNPYHPNSFIDTKRIPYTTPPEDANLIRGHNCVKSQAAVQTVYDPYRLRQPLRRVGPRGSGQWEEISWKQALDEIAERLRPYYQPDTPIDPAFPELGNLPNRVIFSAGRIEHGQKEFTDRIWKNGFGTANYRHDHTSICEVSHHTGLNMVTDYAKNHFKPDILNSDLLMWFGTRPLEANFPMQSLSQKLAEFLDRGGRMITVDPVLSNTAARSHRWLPIKPGTDAALALGMARWIIDNNRYNRSFLTNTAAKVNGEKSFSDATFLVRRDNGTFVRDGSGANMVWSGGQAYSAGEAPEFKGELDPGTVTVDGVEARTVWSLFVDRVREKSIAEYADICGIDADTIADVAREFAAAGSRGVADFYRGPAQHTNGAYNVFAIAALNILNGNFDHKGGYTGGGSHWHETGGKVDGQVSLGSVPDGLSPSGVPISRHFKSYETDAPNLFARDGYPARRPWFPFLKDWNYQEILPSIKDGYPYQADVLITYWNNLLYSAPAAKEVGEQVLADESKVKFFVAFDILIGETSRWADIILPDTTWLERWSTPHISPAQQTKASGYRQPMVGSYLEQVVDGQVRRFYVSPLSQGNVALDFWNDTSGATGPQLLEDILIALGGRLGFPGVGAGGFDVSGAAAGYDWRSGLYSAWDWYLNILNNFSLESGATVDEIAVKGGVFEPLTGSPADPDVLYDGDFVSHTFAKIVHLYIEGLATTRDSMTGELLDPMARYEPTQSVMREPLETPSGYSFHLITYRRVYHAQARTICNPALQGLEPENSVEMNTSDGRALALSTGDTVRITSPDGAFVEGKVRLTEGMRPGVVGVPHSYGHWEMGGNPANTVNGRQVAHDPARRRGIAVNPVMKLDPYLGDVTLQDTIGGSAAFYDSPVRIERV